MLRLALLLLSPALLAGCAKRETPVAEGVKTQTLHIGNYAEPRDLDPHTAVAYSDYNILIALFEGLTAMDEATSQAVPGMAERWTISPDGLTYTFFLREATWSDGAAVTAEDFAFSIQRILTPKLGSEYSSLLYPLKGAEDFNLGRTTDFSTVGVRVIDARTLELTLAKPTPYFITVLGHQVWFPVQKAVLEKYGDPFMRNTGWTKPGAFVGNGAFVLESWVPDQRIVVRKNPRYWNAAKNRLERVVFYPIASPQVEEANYRAGLLHVTYEILPDRIEAYRRERPDEIRIDPLIETLFLRFNVTHPPLDDARVRQALARAIDREAIASAVLRGSRFPARSLVPPETGGYRSPFEVPTDYDEARRLLAEAGYPGGKGFPQLEIQMNTDPVNMSIHEAVQQMWRKELNIEVTLVQLENRVYLDNQHNLAFQINRSRWVADYDDPSTFTDLFVSNSGNNNTGWKNPAYDQLVDQASRELDRAKRFDVLGRAETLLLSEAPIAPIYFGTRTFLIRPEVKGWVPARLGVRRYQTVWLESSAEK